MHSPASGKPFAGSTRDRRVVLCADDYAQTLGTIDGILALLAAARLSAVSCLVESPLWPEAARRLRELPGAFDAGLHFNLTHDFSGARAHRPAALPLMLICAGLRVLSRSEIGACLHRQLDRFEQEMARPPDFVDGHQYIHQLPVVRDVLVSVLRHRYAPAPPAIRVTVPSESRGLKGALIAHLGGYGLLKTLRRERIPHNLDFAGIYDFTRAAGFAERMTRWLAGVRDGGLIVSHPARSGPSGSDPIAGAREREFAYLGSDSFASTLRNSCVRLARFRDLPASAGSI